MQPWMKYALCALGTIALCAFGLFIFVSVWDAGKPRTIESVETEWSQNIRRLGIEPVYPPQEDIAVGDLFAVALEDKSAKDGATIPLPEHSIKLAHLDFTQELEDEYKTLYVFPDTKSRPPGPIDIWEQQQAPGSIFAREQIRKSLPIVLFPGITIARAREAVGGLGGKIAQAAVAIGFSRQERENIDLRISVAETYGVGSIPASRRLAQFCVDKSTGMFCTDGMARNQLSMVIGERIFEKKSPADKTYKHDVELVLVNRVFVARAIESVTDSSFSSSAEVGATKQANELANSTQQLSAIIAALQSETASHEASTETRQVLQEQQAKVQTLLKALANGGQSALGLVYSTEGKRIVATQTLQRPVVIGYRAARYALSQ